MVWHEGDRADTAHLIRSGYIAIRSSTSLGDLATVAIWGPGNIAGLVDAHGSDPFHRTSAVTLEQIEKAVDQVLQVGTLALPRDNDVARAKTQLIASVTYRRDSQFALASAYGQALTIGLTVDDVNEWPARIRAVNAEAVRKAAQSLSRRQAVTAYLIPGGKK